MQSNKQWVSQPSEHEPHVQAVTTSLFRPAGLAMPQLVKKRWGHELIYFNEGYCLKQLFIKQGHSTSKHFHLMKHETLLVTKGVLTLDYSDGKGNTQQVEVPAGEAVVVPPGFQHKLSAVKSDVTLVEGSDQDHPEDSIRVHM